VTLRRPRMSVSAIVWLLLAGIYFLLPLVATLLFSLRSINTNKCCSLAAYHFVFHSGDFWHTLRVSGVLALETIVISLLLFVPTIYWVHLKLPRLRPLIAFLALIPFVVPPIVMVVGVLKVYRNAPAWFYDRPNGILAATYVILAFPYMFFSLDAGFRSIEVHTLTEASQSLGASWPVTLVRVIANLAQFHTFPIFLQYVNETQPYGAAALTLISFGITWGAMLSLLLIGRKRGSNLQLAGAR
jgi:putative spermidine/putrescine transport system permease protein